MGFGLWALDDDEWFLQYSLIENKLPGDKISFFTKF